ncbi:MAG: helix-turn-helix domain-containing protein [Sporolactobacillus sp.]
MKESHRLITVIDAATRLFIRPGYAETKMKEIAAAANLSVGALYHLFESKEALLDFVFRSNINPDLVFSVKQFPISRADTQSFLAAMNATYHRITEELDKKIESPGYSLEQLLNDLYDIFARHGARLLIIEKNQHLNDKLLALHRNYRQAMFERVRHFLLLQIQAKHIRALTSAACEAQLIIDTLMWWCAHKRYDAFEADNSPSPDVMRTVVIRTLWYAYRCQ